MQVVNPVKPATSGFTLVETLVSVSVLAAALLAVAHVSVDATRLQQAIEEKLLADRGIVEQLHLVEATPFAQVQATHDGRGFAIGPGDGTSLSLQAPPGDLDGLAGLVTVAVPNPPNDPGSILDVTIQIDWFGSSGRRRMARTVRLSRIGALR